MAVRTIEQLIYACGHKGLLRTSESVQPHDKARTIHELEGFSGAVVEWRLDSVRCDKCGETGKVRYT
jgi:hypothetical protein